MLYQVIVSHESQGCGHDTPHFDLGVFEASIGAGADNELVVLLSYLCHAVEFLHLETKVRPVSNLVEAWASPEYRCWLLPLDPTAPCLEYTDEFHLVPPERDPR